MIDDIETLKREAKKLSRTTPITHMQALEVLAVQRGYGHWGALAERLGRTAPVMGNDATEAPAPGRTPRALLELLHGTALTQLEGCRHVLVSGMTSAGKTAFLNRLIAALPAGTRITAVEDTRKFLLPEVSASITVSRTAPADDDGDAIAKALSARPDVLVVGEVGTAGATAIMNAMNRPDGPLVATTIHASSASNAGTVFAQRVAHFGCGRLPADVAVVHLERDADGARRIAEMIRSR